MIEQVESQVLDTLSSLQKSNKESRFHDRVITAGFAVIGTLAIWYALQTTKPKDVLQQVRTLEQQVARIQTEITSGTRPADVLVQVNLLQDHLLNLQNEVRDLSNEIKKTHRDGQGDQ